MLRLQTGIRLWTVNKNSTFRDDSFGQTDHGILCSNLLLKVILPKISVNKRANVQKLKLLPVLQNTETVVRFTRGMLFLPERHFRCFSGVPSSLVYIRTLLTFSGTGYTCNYLFSVADHLLKVVDEITLLKDRVLKRLVVFPVH